MTALAKTAAIVNYRPILSSEKLLHKDPQVFGWKMKLLVVSLKMLVSWELKVIL
jgi:hypothetical protein